MDAVGFQGEAAVLVGVGDLARLVLAAEAADAQRHVGPDDPVQERDGALADGPADAHEEGVAEIQLAVVEPDGLARVLADPVGVDLDQAVPVAEALIVGDPSGQLVVRALARAVGEDLQPVSVVLGQGQQQAGIQPAREGHHDAAVPARGDALGDGFTEQILPFVQPGFHVPTFLGSWFRAPVMLHRNPRRGPDDP